MHLARLTGSRVRLVVGVMCVALTVVGCTGESGAEERTDPVEPGCADPAQLSGDRVDPSPTPSYVVLFLVGTDAQREANRLARVYGFTAEVYTITPGFSARFDDDVRERLRCEDSVHSVTYSQTNTPPP
jgi:hypothetical protein